MTLFFNPTGQLMRYQDGMLLVNDLNPEVSASWTMSRMEMLALGWRCVVAAIKGNQP